LKPNSSETKRNSAFSVLLEYAERMKNMQENDLLSAMSDEVKGTVFREN
jgi:hypothetical protein